MPKTKQGSLQITEQLIVDRVFIICGLKVMLDKELAAMYAVKTSRLNEAVTRNKSRFPEDFVFQITTEGFNSLISQNAISKNTGCGGTRKLPYAFTE